MRCSKPESGDMNQIWETVNTLRAREEGRAKRRELLITAALQLVLAPMMAMLSAFIVMLGLGVLHQHFPVVPALGFFETWLALLMVNIVGSAVKTGIKIKPTEEKK